MRTLMPYALVWLVPLAGCASSDAPHRTTLSPRDFGPQRAPAVSPMVALGPARPYPQEPPALPPSDVIGPIAASEGILDVSASPGDPDPAPPEGMGLAVTPPTLVDGVVGNVNNRSIYINDFLDRMGDHLRALARELPRDKWIAETRRVITERLGLEIRDELLLAEARASFVTPEQRANLRAYLQQVQGDLVSRAGGSRAKADQKLTQENERDVTEEVRFRERSDLIRSEIEKIKARITVPFREVALSYEREYDRFNPPPRAEFHLIRIPAAKKDEVASVTASLNAGADFNTIAAGPPNEYRTEAAGTFVQEFSGDYATTEFFGIPGLNDAAHSLTPGAAAGPITLGNYVWWLRLDRINRTAMSLYDAQYSLESDLREHLIEEAVHRLLQRLKDRANFTDVQAMADRLTEIATERYFPRPAN